jgi:hypothetical protein
MANAWSLTVMPVGTNFPVSGQVAARIRMTVIPTVRSNVIDDEHHCCSSVGFVKALCGRLVRE